MSLRQILTTLAGPKAGIDYLGNLVLNRKDGSQIILDADSSSGVPSIYTRTASGTENQYALTSVAVYASVSLTATGSGQRQALGSSKAISLTSAGGGSIYYRFSDASGAIAVTTTDSVAALSTTAVQITVPAAYPFFEYLQVSSGPTFTLGFMS